MSLRVFVAIVLVVSLVLTGIHLVRALLSFIPRRRNRPPHKPRSRNVAPKALQELRKLTAAHRRVLRSKLRWMSWVFGRQGHYWLLEDGTPNARLAARNAWQHRALERLA